MSERNNTPPSEFESLDEAREYLSWVSSEIKNSDDWSEYGDTIRTYVDSLAKSYSEGILDESECDECYGTIPVKNRPFKRSHIEGWFDDAVQKHGQPSTSSGTNVFDEGMPLDMWLDEYVETVAITEFTDSNMTPQYKWLIEFEGQRHVVETNLHHNSASEFETQIDGTFSQIRVDRPSEKYREGGSWKRKFIRPFLDNDSRVKIEQRPGPRTKCINSIKDMLEVRTAYFDIDRADDADGVYIDPSEPDWMFVRSSLIAHEAVEHGFENTEPVRTELEFQGIVDGKVSVQKRLSDGRTPRWWKLPRDFAAVATEDEDDTPAGGERFNVDDESSDDSE
jgi:hypothetical protein